jgi:DNA-binding NtrC family response regulator
MTSAATQELATRMKRIVMTRMRVFITGESGSGKEVVARYFHRISPCCDQPFVAVRCASLAGPFGDHLLFGEKVRIAEGEDGEYRQGALEQSGRGILFLDEVDEMPPAVQSKLVQVIDSGRFSRVGEVGSYMPFEARIISASDIPSRLLRERMRPDLLDRLAVFELCVPPLRERQGDIEPLTRALLPDIALDLGVPPVPIDPHAMAAFRTYDWPGNVRELRNRLTRGLSFAKGPKIGADELFPDLRLSEHGEMRETTLGEMRANADRQHIAQALARHNGRIGDAASSLGISRVTLWSKMKRLGMLHTE